MSLYQAEFASIRELLRKNHRGLTVSEVGKAIGASRNSAAKYLDVMHSTGELDQRTIGRARVFYLSQRIPLASILDYSSDIIVVINESNDILRVNSNILHLFGVDKDKVVGKNLVSDSFKNKSFDQALIHVVEMLNGDTDEDVLRILDKVFRLKVLKATFNDGSQGSIILFEDISEEVKFRETLISLHRYSKTLYQCTSQQELFDITRNTMIEILGFDRPEIWMLDGNVLRQVSTDQRLPSDFVVSLDDRAIIVKTVKENRTIIVPDVTKEHDYYSAEDAIGEELYASYEKSVSELATPIVSNGEVIGVLNVESTLKIPFSENDVILLELLSLHLTNALEKIISSSSGLNGKKVK